MGIGCCPAHAVRKPRAVHERKQVLAGFCALQDRAFVVTRCLQGASERAIQVLGDREFPAVEIGVLFFERIDDGRLFEVLADNRSFERVSTKEFPGWSLLRESRGRE